MTGKRTGEVDWPHNAEHELPLIFNPKGFLVAILPDDAATERARAALQTSGFAATDLRVYTCEEIRHEHGRYLKERGLARKVLSRVTERESDYEFYSRLASEGRGALWVHVAERRDASRAIRYLVDLEILHYRYFGHDEELDLPVHLWGKETRS